MKRQNELKIWAIRAALFTLAAIFALSVFGQTSDRKSASKATEPSIQITLIPPYSEGGDETNGTIGGKASGVNFKECKVVIFTRTDKWYIQPKIASPFTPIGEDGQWETDIHLGHEYAALLVKSSYDEAPSTTGTLPKVGGPVLAATRVYAKKE